MFRREAALVPSVKVTSDVGAKKVQSWSAGAPDSRDKQWLTSISMAILCNHPEEFLELTNKWVSSTPVCIRSATQIESGSDWEAVDPYNIIPSSYLECLCTVNASKVDGEKIRYFAGGISLVSKDYSLSLCSENFVKSAAVLRHWVALDGGPDFCPISYQMPADYSHRSLSDQYRCTKDLVEHYGLFLILVREQDLDEMYSEETNQRGIFPDPALQDLTRLVMRNGGEDPMAWRTILSVLKSGDKTRALIASQMIRIDSPTLIHRICRELLKAPVNLLSILPFLLRRWQHQCTYRETQETEVLRARLQEYLEEYCRACLNSCGKWTLLNCLSNADVSTVCLKLRTMQSIGMIGLCYYSTSISLSSFFSSVVKAHPSNFEVQKLLKDLISGMKGLESLPSLRSLIGSLVDPDSSTLRICVIQVYVRIVLGSHQEKFWNHWIDLLCVCSEIGATPLIHRLCKLIMSEGSHQSHICCEILNQVSGTKNYDWTARDIFYCARENEIQAQIKLLSKRKRFNMTYSNPKIPERACGTHRSQIIMFLKGRNESLSLLDLTREQAWILMEDLLWREPHWCRFNQTYEQCGMNTGFSVLCQTAPSTGMDRVSLVIQKTDAHFESEKNFILLLEEELSWLATDKTGSLVNAS